MNLKGRRERDGESGGGVKKDREGENDAIIL